MRIAVLAALLAAFSQTSLTGMAAAQMAGAHGTAVADTSDLGRAGGFRRPFWVMMRSVMIPGWGQAYNGKWFKAVLFGGVESGFIYGIADESRLANEASRNAAERPYEASYWEGVAQSHRSNRTDYIWWGAFTLLLSMGDAFVDAHLRGFNIEFKQAGDTTLTGASYAPRPRRVAPARAPQIPEIRLAYRVRF